MLPFQSLLHPPQRYNYSWIILPRLKRSVAFGPRRQSMTYRSREHRHEKLAPESCVGFRPMEPFSGASFWSVCQRLKTFSAEIHDRYLTNSLKSLNTVAEYAVSHQMLKCDLCTDWYYRTECIVRSHVAHSSYFRRLNQQRKVFCRHTHTHGKLNVINDVVRHIRFV